MRAPDSGDVLEFSLGELILSRLEEIVEKRAGLAAFTYDNIPEHPDVTYDRLFNSILSLANFFDSNDFFQAGSVVGICLENGHQFVTSFVSTIVCGGIVTTIDPDEPNIELVNQLNDSRASALVCSADHFLKLMEMADHLKSLKTLLLVDRFGKPLQVPGFKVYTWSQGLSCKCEFDASVHVVNPKKDGALIMYPQKPRRVHHGILLTHYAVISKQKAVNRFVSACLGLDPSAINMQKQITTAPFFLIDGICVFLMAIMSGDTMVICNDDGASVSGAVDKYKPSRLDLTVNTALELVKTRHSKGFDRASVRLLRIASDCVGPSVATQLVAMFPNLADFCQGARIPELLNCTHMSKGLEGVGSCGKALPGVEFKETGHECLPNQIGELWARSAAIMSGYWQKPESTANVLTSDGWFLSSKLARRDPQDRLWMVGDANEVIYADSRPVYPAQLEDLLLGWGSVADCAVVGVSHKQKGKVPRALVVKNAPDLTELEVVEHVKRQNRPELELLGGVCFVSKIPRNGSGGVDRQLLVKLFVMRR